jgi:tryptophan-rich sensory protein
MDWFLFLIFLATCLAAGSTGAMFQPGDWYKSLDKPRWTPPDWVFPLAWTTLYLCIAAAAARAAPLEGNAYAMATFALQIALNTLWTPVFFGLRKMGGGMLVIAGLWIAVAATMVLFFQLDTIAGLLFVPYLAWVTIAAALNFSVWRRNGPSAVHSSG